jgi:hypothetical protein
VRIITAWQHRPPLFTVKGFKKCCVSNALDGTDDGMFWDDREEDGNVRSECQPLCGISISALEVEIHCHYRRNNFMLHSIHI